MTETSGKIKEVNQMVEQNQNQTNEVKKLCPFTKEACLEDKCVFWTELMTTAGKKSMCVFNAQMLITATSHAQSQQNIMRMPGGGNFPNLGNPNMFGKG